MIPNLQERFFIYVLGPGQDSRLSSVAAGDTIQEVNLRTDDDAPFVLTGKSVRHAYTSALTQANLQGLKTRFTGPTKDYRSDAYILESLQSAYYGQFGNPKPIVPPILYPSRSVLSVDLQNTGASAITNLSFYFWGYKIFPAGAVPAYTYPRRMASQTFAYPVPVSALGVDEYRYDQIFTVKPDADFVFRAGQGFTISSSEAGRTLAEVSIRLKDNHKQAYSSDFIPFDILFGTGSFPAVVPVGPIPSFVTPFGTGPSAPGIIYPEIYLPRNYQLLYDLHRADGSGGSNQAEDFTFSLIGSKVQSDG
jgi:hypothetical protein